MEYEERRLFMKSGFGEGMTMESDQSKGIPMPAFEDAFDETSLIKLPDPKSAALKKTDIMEIMAGRRSRRKFASSEISMNDLSFLLWATQGMREVKGGRIFRTVPSAGSRHPFETYFYADKVTGLKQGLYRYIASKNAVLPVSFDESLKDGLAGSIMGQWFNCAVALFWVFNAYRCEWRYTNQSHKVSLLDAGHIAQNGYLAAEALNMGCCAIGAYNQKEVDKLLGVDGENEFCVYIEVLGPCE